MQGYEHPKNATGQDPYPRPENALPRRSSKPSLQTPYTDVPTPHGPKVCHPNPENQSLTNLTASMHSLCINTAQINPYAKC